MVIFGCLSLLILPLIGFVIGGYFGGMSVGIGLAAGGFGVAVLACSISVLALVKARRH